MGNAPTHLRPEVIRELQKNTSFTAQEIRELYRQYVHDTGGSLIMSKHNFVKMYEDVCKAAPSCSDEFLDRLFVAFQNKAEGRIEFRSYLITLNIYLKGSSQEKLEWVFDVFGINKTDRISRDELIEIVSILQSLGTEFLPTGAEMCPVRLVDHLFRRAEAADNCHLTRNQFIRGVLASRPMTMVLESANEAASFPFQMRKERSGSFGMRSGKVR